MEKLSEKVVTYILVFLLVLVVLAVGLVLSGWIMYFVGNFIIDVFDINYVWTWQHGFAVSIILTILSNTFKSSNTKD